jgi:hypothetical protein
MPRPKLMNDISSLIAELRNESTKANAYRQLHALGEQAIGPLVRSVQADPTLMGEACDLLMRSGKAAVHPMLELMSTDEAITWLVFQRGPWYFEHWPDFAELFSIGLRSKDQKTLEKCLECLDSQCQRVLWKCPNRIREYGMLGDLLAPLTESTDGLTKSMAWGCIRWIKPDVSLIRPRLERVLLNDALDTAPRVYSCYWAVEAYGPELADTVPHLVAVLERNKDAQTRLWASRALAAMKAEAADALPAMEAFKKEDLLKGDNRRVLNESLRAIKDSISRQAKTLPVDPYVLDLMQRLRAENPSRSGEHPTRSQAKKEIESIQDPAFPAKLKTVLAQDLVDDEFRAACDILEILSQSTNPAEYRGIVLDLLRKPKLRVKHREMLALVASAAKIPGVTPYLLPLLKPGRGGVVLDYIANVPEEEAADALGQYYVENPSRYGHGLTLILKAMEALKSPKLLKYARQVLERPMKDQSYAEQDIRLAALIIIRWVGDESWADLVLRELEAYPMMACIAGFETLAAIKARDGWERALAVFTKVLDEMTGLAAKRPRLDRPHLKYAVTYFQTVGRDAEAGVRKQLERIAEPKLWRYVDAEDQRHIREHYGASLVLPD